MSKTIMCMNSALLVDQESCALILSRILTVSYFTNVRLEIASSTFKGKKPKELQVTLIIQVLMEVSWLTLHVQTSWPKSILQQNQCWSRCMNQLQDLFKRGEHIGRPYHQHHNNKKGLRKKDPKCRNNRTWPQCQDLWSPELSLSTTVRNCQY